jgi:hypothetical protein
VKDRASDHFRWATFSVGMGPIIIPLVRRSNVFGFSRRMANYPSRNTSLDNRVRDKAMAHEGLKRTRIDPAAGQGVPGSVAQHVSVDREWQLSSHAKPLD